MLNKNMTQYRKTTTGTGTESNQNECSNGGQGSNI